MAALLTGFLGDGTYVMFIQIGAIKEMRPDLKDRDLAYLVRTADFDQDAEGWMLRVQNYVANSIDPCIHSPT